MTLGGGYIGSRYFPSCPSCVPDCPTNEREGVRTTLNEGTTPGLPASALSSDIIDGSSTIGTLTAIITLPTQRMIDQLPPAIDGEVRRILGLQSSAELAQPDTEAQTQPETRARLAARYVAHLRFNLQHLCYDVRLVLIFG